jgi:hypothetical protein
LTPKNDRLPLHTLKRAAKGPIGKRFVWELFKIPALRPSLVIVPGSLCQGRFRLSVFSPVLIFRFLFLVEPAASAEYRSVRTKRPELCPGGRVFLKAFGEPESGGLLFFTVEHPRLLSADVTQLRVFASAVEALFIYPA